jgi:hypothetical protein
VFAPLIKTRIEQANNTSTIWINTGNIGPFEAIAVNAGQGEVAEFGFSSVLSRKNVIYLERCRVECSG